MRIQLFLGKAVFILLIGLSSLSFTFEQLMVTTLLTFFVLSYFNPSFSRSFIDLVTPLVLILIISSIVSLFNKPFSFNSAKDFFYLLKPLLFIFIGYMIAMQMNERGAYYRLVICIATFFALIHIFNALYFITISDNYTIHSLRNNTGRDNVLELFALCLLIANKRFRAFEIKYYNVILIVLSISFVLYFSRTMFVLFFIVTLACCGYLRISKKAIKYLFCFILAVGSFYLYLANVEIDRNSNSSIDKFLYKLKIAPSEIFKPASSIDVNNHAELWDHWRAYEAKMAVDQLTSKGIISFIFGAGNGELIDLGFNAPLSDDSEGLRYISYIHNGYIFILFKSGLLGLILFIYFLYLNYNTSKKKLKVKDFEANLLYGTTTFYLFTTLVITGIYNLSDPVSILYGGTLYFVLKKT